MVSHVPDHEYDDPLLAATRLDAPGVEQQPRANSMSISKPSKFRRSGSTSSIGIVGLVPGAGTARPAAVCLLLTAAALLSIVVAALGREATPWLTWLSLAFAGLSFTAALDTLAQGPFERLRVPPMV
jgi:hypothetical protein